jgi:hypothetical protein
MKLSYIIVFSLINILLFIGILKWIHYLITNGYIVEYFSSGTVDLPINISQNCNNMCGPLSRCAITGESCMSDKDCYGCKALGKKKYKTPVDFITLSAYNDSGKSTGNFPQYSNLTNDFTQNTEILIKPSYSSQPISLNYGENLWRETYDQGMKVFKEKNCVSGTLMYKPRETMLGEFVDDGPFPANA